MTIIKDLLIGFFNNYKNSKMELYNEVSFQIELGIYLRNALIDKNYKVEFERNVSFFNLKKSNFSKKEIDIVVYNETKKFAIELKFPTNGQHPEQMFAIVKDIKFCEELCLNGFDNCYTITLTKDDTFFVSKKSNDNIYRKFRDEKKLYGIIEKPTGSKNEKKELNNEYKIIWEDWKDGFKYFIIETKEK